MISRSDCAVPDIETMDLDPEKINCATQGPFLNGMFNVTPSGYKKGISGMRYMTADIGDIKNDKSFKVHMDLNKFYEPDPNEKIDSEDNDSEDDDSETESDVYNSKRYISVKSLMTQFYSYLSDHQEIIHERSVSNIDDVGFITSRFALRNIFNSDYNMTTYYYSAYLINGVIYLNQIFDETLFFVKEKHREDASVLNIPNKKNDSQLDNAYSDQLIKNALPINWGLIFKSYIFSESPNKLPTPEKIIMDRYWFFCTYDLQLNNNRLFYDSCNDGVLPPPKDIEFSDSDDDNTLLEKLKKMSLVHLKMSLKKEDDWKFRKYNFPDIWNLSFLSNIKTVLIGFRSYEGVVEEIKKYSLPDLVDRAVDWSPLKSKDTCDMFLTKVKNTFKQAIEGLEKDGQKIDLKNIPPMHVSFYTEPRSNRFIIHNSLSNKFDLSPLGLYTIMTKQKLKDVIESIIVIEE